jgi:transposase
VCIGFDITEVIDPTPAQLIVRRDLREKLACKVCEAAVVRAPMADMALRLMYPTPDSVLPSVGARRGRHAETSTP